MVLSTGLGGALVEVVERLDATRLGQPILGRPASSMVRYGSVSSISSTPSCATRNATVLPSSCVDDILSLPLSIVFRLGALELSQHGQQLALGPLDEGLLAIAADLHERYLVEARVEKWLHLLHVLLYVGPARDLL